MEKSIERALADAGLSGRDVTPFMRVRVVGLTSKSSQRKTHGKEGLITIWNPSEKQVNSIIWSMSYPFSCQFSFPCESSAPRVRLHALSPPMNNLLLFFVLLSSIACFYDGRVRFVCFTSI